MVKHLLHMVGISTNGASIANDNTQLGVMRHDIEIAKELVQRQTHKGRELRRFGPYEHPGFLQRSSVDPGWWHWRRNFWNAMERRYGAHQCSGTPCPFGSSPMEGLAHFRFICCFGGSIQGSIKRATVANSRCKAQFSDVGSFNCRYLGICPHGPQSGGQALTRAMTAKTERQRARLKARTRCHTGNKLRLRDIIVRSKTFKTFQISASRFLSFCSDNFGRWPQSYIDLDLCLCAFIELVWEEGDPKSWALNAICYDSFHACGARENSWLISSYEGLDQDGAS